MADALRLNIARQRGPQNASTARSHISRGPTNVSYQHTRGAAGATRAIPNNARPGTAGIAGDERTPSTIQNAMSNVRSQGGASNMTLGPNIQSQASKYQVGQIVRLPHIVPSLDSQEPNKDYRIHSNVVGYICPKSRYAVIVAIYPTRMIVLPMYSCHQNGIKYKNADYQLTAMSIMSPDEDRPACLDPKRLTKERLLNAGDTRFDAGSHINLNEPMSVNYGWRIRYKDCLSQRSRDLLLKRYAMVHKMAWQEDQRKYFLSSMNEEQRQASLGAGGFKVSKPVGTAQSTAASKAPTAVSTTKSGFSYAQMANRT